MCAYSKINLITHNIRDLQRLKNLIKATGSVLKMTLEPIAKIRLLHELLKIMYDFFASSMQRSEKQQCVFSVRLRQVQIKEKGTGDHSFQQPSPSGTKQYILYYYFWF